MSDAQPKTGSDLQQVPREHSRRDSEERQTVVQNSIARKETRRLRARHHPYNRVWFGLGMFGLIGWSVAIPTVLGASLGMWLDARWDGPQSWTLMLLVGGLIAGCLNAWRWVREESEIKDD